MSGFRNMQTRSMIAGLEMVRLNNAVHETMDQRFFRFGARTELGNVDRAG